MKEILPGGRGEGEGLPKGQATGTHQAHVYVTGVFLERNKHAATLIVIKELARSTP